LHIFLKICFRLKKSSDKSSRSFLKTTNIPHKKEAYTNKLRSWLYFSCFKSCYKLILAYLPRFKEKNLNSFCTQYHILSKCFCISCLQKLSKQISYSIFKNSVFDYFKLNYFSIMTGFSYVYLKNNLNSKCKIHC
jgi:hypothetical protein